MQQCWLSEPTVLELECSVMVIAGADDFTVALQWFEDLLQRRLAHVEAVAMPDRRQDVQDVATFIHIYGHRRTHKHIETLK